jgi:hypothetical protein
LHVLDMGGCVFHQSLSLAQIGAERRDVGIRAETAAWQTMGMKLAQPCGIADIRLAPWRVLGVTRVHQNDLKPALPENLLGRDPIDPGGLHRDTGHATRFEPVCQLVQILCERAKRTYRRVSAPWVDRRHVHF